MRSRSTKSKRIPSSQLELYRAADDNLAAQEFSRDSAEQRKSAEEIASRNRTAASQLLFVIKKHDATRLHYDLRLEWNWVLLSWALPEGLSYCPEHKREAIQVEDHAREHAGFEGMIPEGRRGAGTVMQWDVGTWEPRSGYTDVDAALRDGCLKFTMHGQKIKGNWTLTRISNKPGDEVRSYWLFSKDPDDYARAPHEVSILEEAPNSVLTNKTLEDIHRDWIKGKDKSKVQAKLF